MLNPSLVERFKAGEIVIQGEGPGVYLCIVPIGDNHHYQMVNPQGGHKPIHVTRDGVARWICPQHSKENVENFSRTKGKVINLADIKLTDEVKAVEVAKETKMSESKEGITISLSLEDLEGDLGVVLDKIVNELDNFNTPTLKVAKRLMSIQEKVNNASITKKKQKENT